MPPRSRLTPNDPDFDYQAYIDEEWEKANRSRLARSGYSIRGAEAVARECAVFYKTFMDMIPQAHTEGAAPYALQMTELYLRYALSVLSRTKK